MLGRPVIDDSGEQASDTIIEALFLSPLKFKNHGAEHQTSGGDIMSRLSPGCDSENHIHLKHVTNSL